MGRVRGNSPGGKSAFQAAEPARQPQKGPRSCLGNATHRLAGTWQALEALVPKLSVRAEGRERNWQAFPGAGAWAAGKVEPRLTAASLLPPVT